MKETDKKQGVKGKLTRKKMNLEMCEQEKFCEALIKARRNYSYKREVD